MKPNSVPDENSRNSEKIVKSSREKRKNIKRIKTSILKWNTRKYLILSYSIESKFMTKQWIEISGLLGGQCSMNKNIRFKTPMLRLNLCNNSDTHSVAKGKIIVEGNVLNNCGVKKPTFKNNSLAYRKLILLL